MSGRRVSIALTREPRSVGKLAEELEISPPSATRFVDMVAEHAMAERRHDPTDGRAVLVN